MATDMAVVESDADVDVVETHGPFLLLPTSAVATRHASFEEWEAHEINRKAFDPSLWWVAEAEGRIVGAIVCPDYEGEGWIRQLGVARDWRGRGIATALLLTAFHEFKRRGRRDSSLVVDSWNRTGAKRVYERLGMRAERTHSRFEKELRPAG